MKRKKSNKAQKVAKQVQISSEYTDGNVLETSANCSLCLSDESPIYECQEFLFDDLESAFGCSLKITEKSKFKICVTCSYHISILAKFVNENICLSGVTPICFMCKNFTVFDIRPNDLKAQLKNTPLGIQMEDKANYYACVVCLYQLMKYQHYKHLIENYRTAPGTPTTSTTSLVKSSAGYKQITPESTESPVVSTTKTKNGPTVLLQKLDLSKFKLTSFMMIKPNALDEQDVSSTKSGRKRGRSDSIYTEVLPKKRRYQPSPSPEPSDHSDEDDTESLVFETWGSTKKSGKRVTINTRPSVMRASPGASKTPMKSALKAPQKPPASKVKSTGKFQIKFPVRAIKSPKESPEPVKVVGSGRPVRTSTVVKPAEPAKPATPAKLIKSATPTKPTTSAKPATPFKSPTTAKTAGRPKKPIKSSPRLPVKLDTTISNKTDVDEGTADELNESKPENPKVGRKKRVPPKKPSPMKTPAEKKQMVTVLSSDQEDEAKDDSDAEDIAIVGDTSVEVAENAEDVLPEKIADLTDDKDDDDQAEVIIPEDTDKMGQIVMDDDSEAQPDGSDNENATLEKGSRGVPDKFVEPNTSANTLDDDDSPVVIGDSVSDLVEFIKSTIAQEAESKIDNVAESASNSTKVGTAGNTATNNGNSNSDKENTVDLLRDESNSSDFGVIKKLNNNERVQLDINMDKIFDELRTEATP